jgi:hypothetical protein
MKVAGREQESSQPEKAARLWLRDARKKAADLLIAFCHLFTAHDFLFTPRTDWFLPRNQKLGTRNYFRLAPFSHSPVLVSSDGSGNQRSDFRRFFARRSGGDAGLCIQRITTGQQRFQIGHDGGALRQARFACSDHAAK